MNRTRRGFTLVEVLVALVIMAVVAAMGWQGVAGMARAREIGTEASERTLRLSAVVGQWEADLAAIYDSPQVPGLSFDGASLRIARRTDDGVQLVVWSLREGRWLRWPGPVSRRIGELQQAGLASQQLQGNEPGQLLLLEGITDWQLYFWRDQGVAEGRSVTAASSPCYLNRQEPLELAFGWGKALEQALRLLLETRGLPDSDIDPAVVTMMAECLAPPLREFKFPRDL